MSDYLDKKLRRRTSEEAKLHAKRNGWLCEEIPDNVLFVDLDTAEQAAQFETMLPSIKFIYPVTDVAVTVSKSGNKHARVHLSMKLSIVERIAAQTILGSDPKKEVCSLLGFYQCDPAPILAYEKSI